MARPRKQGLEYFPFDVDFFENVKVRKIARACGPASTSMLICLLCNIYKDKGYYILWDEDLSFVVADTIGTTEGAVEEVIKKALQVDFFNKELFDKYKILTSRGIQERFKSAITRREETEYVPEFLVSEYKNVVSACKNEVIVDRSTQSKVKVKRKKRDNNITPTPPKGGVQKSKSEPKSINSEARFLFEQHFKETFSTGYYWTAKDAGNMSQLIKKLAFSRSQKGLSIDDASILYALQVFLSSIKEGWIFENFSVTNINSKFNEIVSQARANSNGAEDRKLSKSEKARNLLDQYNAVNSGEKAFGDNGELPDL